MTSVEQLQQLLAATLDPSQQREATKQLEQLYRAPGFALVLLHIINQRDPSSPPSTNHCSPVQQAAAIYLKNLVELGWRNERRPLEPGEVVEYVIGGDDRRAVCAIIVESAVHAPERIRRQLLVCIKAIIRADFPQRWPGLVDRIRQYLDQPNAALWPGALGCLYQLVKYYEFRDGPCVQVLVQIMNTMLPLICRRLADIVADTQPSAVDIQRIILKNFRVYVNYQLHLEQITRESFSEWMRLILTVAARAVPQQAVADSGAPCQDDDDLELSRSCWWKCRKWALHILYRTLDRYGLPGFVMAKYEEFAAWYLNTFVSATIQVLLQILDEKRRGQFVAPRVLQLTLSYLNKCVNLSFSWKLLRPHVQAVVKEVLLPLLCFSKKDAQLWEEDPHEFIRLKYDPMEDFVSPTVAARLLLSSIATKRHNSALPGIVRLIVDTLSTSDLSPQHKDGILHLLGSVSGVLCSNEKYSHGMPSLLTLHVMPDFVSQHPHLRARACWVMQRCDRLRYSDESGQQCLAQAVAGVVTCLLQDQHVPVQVEAAIALEHILHSQPCTSSLLQNTVEPLLMRLLQMIQLTGNQELTSVLQSIVSVYRQQLTPVVLQLTASVVGTFQQMLTEDQGMDAIDCYNDSRLPTLSGLLSTMDVLVDLWDNEVTVSTQLEAIVLKAMVLVLENSVIDLYDEVFRLMSSLTMSRVSDDLWHLYQLVHKMFEDEGVDFFDELMPALHNYVTVDTAAFVAQEWRIDAALHMCQCVLSAEPYKLRECQAVKLIECVVLQCQGHLQKFLPAIVQLVVSRLSRAVSSTDLRVLCLVTLISVLYTESAHFDSLLAACRSSTSLAGSSTSTTSTSTAPTGSGGGVTISQFVSQWLSDHHFFTGLHDGKVYVLGWCVLLRQVDKYGCLQAETARIMPALLNVLQSLRSLYLERTREYQNQRAAQGDAASTSVTSNDAASRPMTQSGAASGDDKDDDDEANVGVRDKYIDHGGSDSDEWDCEERCEEYVTSLDTDSHSVNEFSVFGETVRWLQQTHPHWFSALTAPLSSHQHKLLADIVSGAVISAT